MKKNRKYIYIIGGICAVVLGFNARYLRNVVARHFETVSVEDAVDEMQKALETKYPDKSFEWMSGGYTDSQGYANDSCYTSNFMVNGQKDNIVSVTYSDVNFENVWKGNPSIAIDEKGHERKVSLVKRLCRDYTALLRKEVGKSLRDYTFLENISVTSPYEKRDCARELPENLEYEMEFTPELNLAWEFNIILPNYEENEAERTVREIVNAVERHGFEFNRYNIAFKNEGERVYYIYDEDGKIFKQDGE